ncbi:uncharacterized protein LOC108164012 [Drosophila miranda]|uniref:uncharacterized protein LOC108164012 n=1 Tax=Drosophila miranda TaxID=7229 RepID=UPI0007E6EFD7|nr:uncharacterized protein LOC108164012 [Drosophila miranda]
MLQSYNIPYTCFHLKIIYGEKAEDYDRMGDRIYFGQAMCYQCPWKVLPALPMMFIYLPPWFRREYQYQYPEPASLELQLRCVQYCQAYPLDSRCHERICTVQVI